MINLIKNIILIIMLSISFTVFAGPFEGGGGPQSIYKSINGKKEIPNRQLNLVLRNSLYKAKVQKHPSSKIKLFDACINGDYIESISKSPRMHCLDWSEEQAIVDGKEVIKLTCKYWSKNMRLKNAIKYAKKNPKECSLVLGSKHPNQNLYGNRPNEIVPLCNFKKKISKLQISQSIEVYSMNDFTSEPIYYHEIDSDRAQPGHINYKYTLPTCTRE